MAASFVQSTSGHTSGFPQSISTTNFSSATTSGSAILVAVAVDGTLGNITSVTDSQSNTYSKAVAASDFFDLEIWYALNITGGSSFNVTANYSSFADAALVAFEVAGIATSSALDKTHTATGSGTGLDSGSTGTTTQAGEYLFGAGMGELGSGTMTVGSGYSNLKQDNTSFLLVAAEGQVVSSTGAYNATMTWSVSSQNWVAAIATFKDTGTSTSTVKQLAALGVG